MDSKQIELHSQTIKKQADHLLKSTDLIEILNKFGKVHIIGSYPLDVMYGPDIDILVETEESKNNSKKALQEIVDKELFRKVEYGNFVKFQMPNRPNGYILVLKTELNDVKWEIEVWFLEDASKQLNYNKSLELKINDHNRIEILKAKHLRETSNTSKHKLSSYDIYEQTLFDN